MAIVISGVNNNDKITASDGTIDLLSGVNYVGVITAPSITASNNITAGNLNIGSNIQLGNAGVATATTFVGNLTGNVNATSNLLLQIGGSEKFRVASSGQLGIGGANYGTSGQVLTSGGSSSAATWSTISGTTINNNAANRIITGSGTANTLEGNSNFTYTGSVVTHSNPSGLAKLDVKGDVSGGALGASISVRNTNSANNGSGEFQFQDPGSNIFAKIAGVNLTDGSNNGYMTFHTSSATSGLVERLRIDDSGDIGLGESSPNRSGYSSPVTSVGYNSSNGYGVLELLGNQTSNNTIANIVAYNVGGSSRLAAIGFERSGANNSGAIRFETYTSGSSSERMRISKEGYVTKPATPAFFASHSGADNNQTGYLTFNSGTNGYYNNGNHFDLSTGAFHAPVTGIYFFHFHGFLQVNISVGSYEYTIRRANSDGSGVVSVCRQYGYRDHQSQYGPNVSMMTTQPMTAGQTMRVHIATKPLHGSNGYYFGGYLIG